MSREASSEAQGLGFKPASARSPANPEATDITAGLILYGLEIGIITPLIKWIEQGKLPYLATLMTEKDHTRLIRALHTGSSLTSKEGSKSFKPRQKRDEFLIQRIIYWRARGYPVFDNTNSDNAIAFAIKDYSTKPLSRAPAQSVSSAYKQVWLPFQNRNHQSVIADDVFRPLIEGMSEAGDKSIHDQTLQWCAEKILAPDAILIVEPPLKNQLARLLGNSPTSTSQHILNRMREVSLADRIRFLKGEQWI